jgi:hypothetical protein
MQEIHLHFPRPGKWDKYTMTAVYQDADGYTHTDHYTQDDIPADQAPVLEATVTAIASMGEDWQASQVWARLEDFINFDRRPDEPTSVESVWLTVEAVNPQGGRRTFTATDYPDFIILDPAAIVFFKHFTTNK